MRKRGRGKRGGSRRSSVRRASKVRGAVRKYYVGGVRM